MIKRLSRYAPRRLRLIFLRRVHEHAFRALDRAERRLLDREWPITLDHDA